MAKKHEPSQQEIPQSERFKRMARELAADETGEAFERVLRRIVPPITQRDKDHDDSGDKK